MSEPPQEFPTDLMYESSPPGRNASLLLKLTMIFTYIVCGLHLMGGLLQTTLAIFMPYAMQVRPPAAAPGAPAPPAALFAVIYGVLAFVALAAAIVNFIAADRLRKRQRGAFAWILASAIVNVAGIFWCSLGCVLPLAAGIFTIVVLCQEGVRKELAINAA